MRFPIHSLRTGILSHLVLLIVASMLLINVVTIKLTERDFIRARVQSARQLLRFLGQRVEYQMTRRHNTWADMTADSSFRRDISQLLKEGEAKDAIFADKNGVIVFSTGQFKKEENESLSLMRECLSTGNWGLGFYGKIWGVVWFAPENFKISTPIIIKDHIVGGITLCEDFRSTYQKLRKTENIILIYIFLNTIMFVLFGTYLLSRTVVKPVYKLLRMTEEFEVGESFPFLHKSSRNELSQILRSLSLMLRRLKENREELNSHISSLQKANKEIKKAQNEIIRSEKLASTGLLATGVAHEIGNPTGIILGYLELLKRGDLSSDEKKDFLDRIESEVTRINLIIRQLLDFSRPSTCESKPISVHNLIIETVNMFKLQPVMSRIETAQLFEAETDAVWADANQLKQVFINLFMNAADSMMDKGQTDDDFKPMSLTIKTLNRENSIIISFIDTGTGIKKKKLSQIFDPFYTTKEPGKGTGLGLYVCYRIIEDIGGAIQAESTPGKGTTILIDIPLLSADEQHDETTVTNY